MEFVNAVKIIQKGAGEGWFGTTHNMNIYRGCNQGCIYCDSRSSCYQIQEFDRIRAKKDAPQKIEQELAQKRSKGVISMGGMSDPYNQFESEYQLTRQALLSIKKYGFGVSCITKNDLILRDIDLFKEINKTMPVSIGITITTSNDRLQSRIERNITSTSKRFEAVKKLNDEGLFAGILMMPLLPFINDTIENIEGIIKQAVEANAKFIYPSFGVTLRDNQRLYFFNKIGEQLTQKYIETFNDSYVCVSPNHKELRQRFIELCTEHNILYKMSDIVAHTKKHVQTKQLTLFD